jgi:hypothetical protein
VISEDLAVKRVKFVGMNEEREQGEAESEVEKVRPGIRRNDSAAQRVSSLISFKPLAESKNHARLRL